MNENKSPSPLSLRRVFVSLREMHPDIKMMLLSIALFVMSAGFLAWKIDRDLSPASTQNSFTIAFENRDPRSLEFFIENQAEDQTFTYTIRRSGQREEEKKETAKKFIPGGERERIALPPAASGGRASIIVEDESGEKQEIYRQP